MSPFFNSRSIIFCFKSLEMSSFRGLYTSGLFKCSIAFWIYSSLSSTTIVEPLSALFIIRLWLWINSLNANRSFLVRLSLLFVNPRRRVTVVVLCVCVCVCLSVGLLPRNQLPTSILHHKQSFIEFFMVFLPFGFS